MLALVIVVFVLFIGDVVAVRTKAWIPSVFISAILFLFGYWTFFPQDIVSIAGVPPVVATMMMYLLITNMGTLLSVKELINQWKTIVISLSGILGIVALLFGIGTFIFDSRNCPCSDSTFSGRYGIFNNYVRRSGRTQDLRVCPFLPSLFM